MLSVIPVTAVTTARFQLGMGRRIRGTVKICVSTPYKAKLERKLFRMPHLPYASGTSRVKEGGISPKKQVTPVQENVRYEKKEAKLDMVTHFHLSFCSNAGQSNGFRHSVCMSMGCAGGILRIDSVRVSSYPPLDRVKRGMTSPRRIVVMETSNAKGEVGHAVNTLAIVAE